MSDWTQGYTTEIEYTYGYYSELNPQRIRLAFAYNGLAFPEIGTACELGFGQGLGVNMHAAASVVQWSGTDFNPSHTAFAAELAHAAGASARLYDQSFAEFASRDDLPDFDYICLHGIFSWISEANRAVIVDFVRRRLKVGGVLYISYNTLPGWAEFAPVQHLISLYGKVHGSREQGMVARVDDALGFTERLFKTQPGFARANPQAQARLEGLATQNRHYLAHEYFNEHWVPMYFAQMAECLDAAKLQFACSANFLDYVPKVHFTAEQLAMLDEIRDPVLQQGVRDFMVNQRFRKDYWVRGARRLSPLARAEKLRQMQVMLMLPRDEVRVKFMGALGESSLMETVVQPVLGQLEGHQIRSIGEIEQAVVGEQVNFQQMTQALVVLIATGQLELAQSPSVVVEARKQTDRLNARLLQMALASSDVAHLASPVTGGGVLVGRFQQLFLLARSEGNQHPAEWAQFAWNALQQMDQVVVKDGKALGTAEDNLTELMAQAKDFEAKRLPLLQALQIA